MNRNSLTEPAGNSIENPALAWVVLLPTPQARVWEIVIRDAAAAAGLPVVVFNDESERLEVPSSSYLVLTINPRLVADNASNYVVVAAGLDEWCDKSTGFVGAQELAQMSEMLEAASHLNAVWLTEGDAGRRDLELWPGFHIDAPPERAESQVTRLTSAVREAMRLYGGSSELGARWSQELFLYDSRREDQRRCVHELDVMGPARALVFGPYITLPIGRWKATMRFCFDGDAARHRYRVEWGTTTQYASEAFVPGVGGVFELVLTHEWLQAERAEMRVILTQGSLGGIFNFLGMRVEQT